MSATRIDQVISASTTVVAARSNGYTPPRWPSGSTPSRRALRYARFSRTMSTTDSAMIRNSAMGVDTTYRKRSWLFDLSVTELNVNMASSVSPVNTFARDAPPPPSNPTPLDWRDSISAASFGRFVTITRPVSFSYQRNAGMLWLSPSRMPACMAPVCDDRSHSQPCSTWVPHETSRPRNDA